MFPGEKEHEVRPLCRKFCFGGFSVCVMIVVMNKSFLRVLGFVFMSILVVVLPWWLSFLLLAGLTIYLNFYLEVIFFGFLIDSLYSVQNHFPYTGLVVSTIFLVVTMFVKTRIRKF